MMTNAPKQATKTAELIDDGLLSGAIGHDNGRWHCEYTPQDEHFWAPDHLAIRDMAVVEDLEAKGSSASSGSPFYSPERALIVLARKGEQDRVQSARGEMIPDGEQLTDCSVSIVKTQLWSFSIYSNQTYIITQSRDQRLNKFQTLA